MLGYSISPRTGGIHGDAQHAFLRLLPQSEPCPTCFTLATGGNQKQSRAWRDHFPKCRNYRIRVPPHSKLLQPCFLANTAGPPNTSVSIFPRLLAEVIQVLESPGRTVEFFPRVSAEIQPIRSNGGKLCPKYCRESETIEAQWKRFPPSTGVSRTHRESVFPRVLAEIIMAFRQVLASPRRTAQVLSPSTVLSETMRAAGALRAESWKIGFQAELPCNALPSLRPPKA